MARIVPARPRAESAAEEDALLSLERSLDDSWVVFQQRPKPGQFIVVHPDFGVASLIALDGAQSYDGDLDCWGAADLHANAREAKKSLDGLVSDITAFAYLPDTPAPSNMAGHKLVVFSGQSITDSVRTGLMTASAKSIGDEAVNAILQSIAPNAMAYARGEITPAQKEWRSSRVSHVADILPTEKVANLPNAAPLSVAESVKPSMSDPLGLEQSLTQAKPKEEAEKPVYEEIDDFHPMIDLLRQIAESVINGRKVYAAGVSIGVSNMVGTDFLLPALMVCAAEDWAPIVSTKGGKGGFTIRLKSDPDALLGYRVASIEPSAPLLMALPFADRIRRAVNGVGENADISLDDTIYTFRRWLEMNKFDSENCEMIDLRIIMGT